MLMPMSHVKRRYPIGAELIGENQTHFRVWAPKARKVDVVLEDAADAKPKFYPLTAEPADIRSFRLEHVQIKGSSGNGSVTIECLRPQCSRRSIGNESALSLRY
jgi:hypothetical protein